jgi:hypothetical protein
MIEQEVYDGWYILKIISQNHNKKGPNRPFGLTDKH